MNKLVKVTKTKAWSEWCDNVLGKYCVFKTNDGKVVGGFVEEYAETCEPIKIRDFNTMIVAKIRPIDIAQGVDCEIYDLKYGVLKNKLKIKDTILQRNLITEKETYTFEYIDMNHIYSFVRDGFIKFLACTKWDKDKATFKLLSPPFDEKEYTAKEFYETFDELNEVGYCGCPYVPSCADDTFDFFTAVNYLKEGRKVRRVDWAKGEYISINKREDGYVVENESGIKISTLEFSPFESNWELYSEE